MSIPAKFALWAMPQLLSCGEGGTFPPYHDVRRMEMLRLGIGVAIGWFAYDALQKRGDSLPELVKSCVVKAVETFKKDNNQPNPSLSTTEEGKEECAK